MNLEEGDFEVGDTVLKEGRIMCKVVQINAYRGGSTLLKVETAEGFLVWWHAFDFEHVCHCFDFHWKGERDARFARKGVLHSRTGCTVFGA